MNPDGLLADAVLLLWIPMAIALFLVMRAERAALITIFGGLLFLPELVSFKLPLLPPIDKQTIPYFAALIGFTIRTPGRVWRLPRERWITVITLIIIVGGIGITLTNGDALSYGVWRKIEIPGLTIKDGMYVSLSNVFRIAVPFFLGTVVVREVSDLEDLFRFLAKAGLVYSFFALLEIRLSPQLHYWIYGFQQHEFVQSMRFGGYRPTVFMAHGLAVALFLVVSVMCGMLLTRLGQRRIWGLKAKTATLILAVVLVLCKSTGAIVYVALSAPLLLWGSVKLQQRIATILAVVVLLYPSMRESDVFPTSTVLSLSEMAGGEREASVAYRFKNEEMLLKKARQRPWFGWGQYDRNEVFDEYGKRATVTDGEWIIALGIAGFTGFLSSFGLLLIPVFLTGRRLRLASDDTERRLVAATSLIVAVTALDLLPNSLFSNYPYFLSGALLSASAALLRSRNPGYRQAAGAPDFMVPTYRRPAPHPG
jgi:O-antigen ligase